jgi:pre-mRNA-processing factor 19
MVATSEALSKTRRKRKPSPSLTPVEKIQTFSQTAVAPSLHNTRSPGISCIDLDPVKGLVLSGGNDHHVLIYDMGSKRVTATLKGHGKKITSVRWRGNLEGEDIENIVMTASADKTVRIWKPFEKTYRVAHTLSDHTDEVTSLTVHPSKQYFVSAAMDSSWAFHDIETGKTFVKITDSEHTGGYSSAEFHPDGMIMGAGLAEGGLVRIWDVRQQRSVASFPEHEGRVNALAFSENGYLLATAAQDSVVKLWDLRKLINFKTFDLDDDTTVLSLDFDYSGVYLAVGGSDLRVLKAKEGTELFKWQENTASVTGVKWGPDAKYLVTGGLDRSLRIFGSTE